MLDIKNLTCIVNALSDGEFCIDLVQAPHHCIDPARLTIRHNLSYDEWHRPMIGVLGINEPGIGLAISSSGDTLSTYVSMLVIAIFEAALTLGIMIAIAWVLQRLFKSYTSGFYWSFVAIVIIEIILTIARQPSGLIG